MSASSRKNSAAFIAMMISVFALSACGARVERQSSRLPAGQQSAVQASPTAGNDAPATEVPPPAADSPTATVTAPAKAAAGTAVTARGDAAGPQAGGPQRDGFQPGAVSAPRTGNHSSTAAPQGASGSPASAGQTGAPKPETPQTTVPSQAVRDRSPFVIGTVGTVSGPAGNALKPQVDGLQAWVKWTNDRGGVKGHPVNLIAADDGGDTARHRALVQEFVERRGVMAFVNNTEVLTGQGSIEYLSGKGIPLIGSDTGSDWFNTNPNYFPQAPSGSRLILGMLGASAHLMVPEGKRKLGIITCTEAQVCREADRIWSEQAAAYGFEVVYRGKGSVAQPDFTAECLAARSAGVQVMILAIPGSGMRRIAASCVRQGIKFTYSLAAPDVKAEMAEDPNFNNSAFVGFHGFPWTVRSTPATAEFQDVIAKYLRIAPSAPTTLGWISGKLFEKVASTVTGAPSTRAVLEGLWTIKNDSLGGLTAPLTYTKGQPAQMPICWFELVIKDGRWVALNPDAARCRS